jgi:serine/threonine protein kinase
MPLNSGSRLGRYEILGALGAGGMGEVYRARDERLGRDVAIKVLREESTADPDLQRRFAIEARSASALNHPNILTVHDVGMEQNIPYIVSELVDGEPLGSLIARGKIPIRRVLDIAIQVADGLAAAHQAGIVHRDLKPANIMLTKAGSAKVLDFGLAKAVPKEISGANTQHTATMPGIIVGTATYMSPEQVRGESLDPRSDQFSFGLVLFEMLTGKAPFARSSDLSTMAAIAEEPAPPIRELNPAVPAPLRWCVERCIAKDREERYASTTDLKRELKTIRDHLDETTASQPDVPAQPVKRKRRIVPILLGLAGFAAGSLLAPLLLIPDSAVDVARYRISPIAVTAAYEGSPAWSPDGKSIAYTAYVEGISQVFVRSLSAPTAAQVTKSRALCDSPFWSPDNNRIYYLTWDNGNYSLWEVGATGGSPDLVQRSASAAAISPDGRTLAFLRTDSTGKEPLSLWLAPPAGGTPRKFTGVPFSSASAKYAFGYLAFSPDGKQLGAWLSRWDGGSEFWLLPYPEGVPRLSFTLLHTAYPFSWMPDNRRLVFGGQVPGSVGSDLQMIDSRRGTIRPLSVTTQDAVQASVSPDGRRIAYTVAQDDFDLIDVPLDGAPVRTVLSTGRNEFDPGWSWSGNQLAYSTDRTGTSQIWVRQRDGFERPLVTEKDFDQTWIASFDEPNFSPDDQRIAYTVAASSGHAVYVSSVAGGKPIRVSDDKFDQRSPTWSPDGACIAYLQNIEGSWALVKARSGGGGQPIVLRQGCLPSHPKWQHKNGRWIACVTPEGLTLVSEDGKDTKALSKSEWPIYGWNAEGTLLYGIKQVDSLHRAVASLNIETGAEKIIGPLQLPAIADLSGYSLSPDGKSFATSASHPTGDIWMLENFERPGWKAWFEGFGAK